MKYVLAVLTHGDNAEMLDGLMNSFVAFVSPAPEASLIVQDGPCAMPPTASLNWRVTQLSPQGGFCAATEELWRESIRVANEVGATHVFHLEHDFRFRRPVDLRDMATVLGSSDRLAQVSLMRQACNPTEERAGGVVPATRDRGYNFVPRRNLNIEWIEHAAYFTTNANLMRIDFMSSNPWPTLSACEGRFGIDLIERGYNFAILGDGTPWIEHVGIRTGYGY